MVKMMTLTNPPKAQEILINDKGSGGSSVPLVFMHTLTTNKAAIPPERFKNCPVLLTQPDEDFWTPLSASAEFFDRLACEKHLVMLKDCGHYPLEEEGLRVMHQAIDKFVRGIVDQSNNEQARADAAAM